MSWDYRSCPQTSSPEEAETLTRCLSAWIRPGLKSDECLDFRLLIPV